MAGRSATLPGGRLDFMRLRTAWLHIVPVLLPLSWGLVDQREPDGLMRLPGFGCYGLARSVDPGCAR